MDANWFDALTTSVSRSGTRRRLVAALPLAGMVGVLFRQEAAQGEGKRKKACAKAGQTPNKGKRKGCCKGLTRDASGRCAAPGPDPDSCTGLEPTATSATQGLQEAIDGAESGDTLTLCAGTWNLTSTVLIDKDLILHGAGAITTILDGSDAVQVLQIVSDVTVTVLGLQITSGNAGADYGGGIRNDGTLNLQHSTVAGNSAGHGGGIFNYHGMLTLQHSTVSGNTSAFSGGGIRNDFGTLTLQDSTVSGNTADVGGGGYNNRGTLTLKAGSGVSGNTVRQHGGGIENVYGIATLEADTNVSGNSRGGIYNSNDNGGSQGTVNVANATIVTNNTPTNCAGKAVSPPQNCIN